MTKLKNYTCYVKTNFHTSRFETWLLEKPYNAFITNHRHRILYYPTLQ